MCQALHEVPMKCRDTKYRRMLQANRDELDLGLTLRASDSQKFLVRCVSMLCRIALVVHLFDKE